MRRGTLILAFVFLALPAGATAQQNDTTAVMATLQRFVDGLRAKDTVAMKAELHEQARLTLLRPAPGGGVRVVALDGPGFIRAATAGPALDEPIRHPRVTIDADLATVWAEYQVRINGQVSHCGYDAFHLVRVAGAWKILNVSDTFRQQGCGAAW
jgi:hypothetical protein